MNFLFKYKGEHIFGFPRAEDSLSAHAQEMGYITAGKGSEPSERPD